MITAIIAAFADMAGARASLATAQMSEEFERQKQKLMLGALGVVFGCSGLALATLLVAVFFWDTHRVAALAALTLLHLACSAAAFVSLRKRERIREREKRLLIMRSTLAQLRLQVAAARLARSPGMAIVGSIARLARGFLGSRDIDRAVPYRTEGTTGRVV